MVIRSTSFIVINWFLNDKPRQITINDTMTANDKQFFKYER